ncbi:hypothetical protein [Paraburkholderia aromaticivorans]|uniref:Uncharacterized protein n=1 Tax=Paraburkholderia aromaticivorans TaxID=2026199 RepID=A0A248VYP8_9BURK|nr:hypothetical protein [Paraburkholderia aromaticivorans]ASW03652.1 hypothetical protein CJU94_36220 [Paraburkholderia aromaticivorans]
MVGQYWIDAVQHEKAVGLLREALKHISDKPWEESTLLHARISEYLGEPIQHADAVVHARAGRL